MLFRSQLRNDTPDGPHVDGLVVVLRAEEELGRAVPDRDDDLVAGGERLEGLVREPGEPEVPDFDDAGGGDEDVGGLEVAVDDVRVVQVEQAVEELVAEGFEDVWGDGGAEGLGVVVDELLVWDALGSVAARKKESGLLTRKSCSAYSKTM